MYTAGISILILDYGWSSEEDRCDGYDRFDKLGIMSPECCLVTKVYRVTIVERPFVR